MDSTSTPHKPPSHVLRYEGHPLESVFAPKSVAVIGATDQPGTVGHRVLSNLTNSRFGGAVYPVNRRGSTALGLRCYRTIRDVPEHVDLAVVVTNAGGVLDAIRDCANAGVLGAIVTSAGFREMGPEGMALEQQVVDEARRGGLRLIGPNCLGVMSPATGLNATFAANMARPGNVAFLSQSGALCTAVLDWSLKMNVGFSHFVSIGAMADVGWGDLIDYLGGDPRTKSIVVYMESVGADASPFLSAAREVALTKPIIVIKAGRTAAAAKAAASHTGALTGSDEVLNAAFRRVGVLRVNSLSDVFYMAEALDKQPRPKGPRLTIVTNAGGPGVLATDALLQNGGDLTTLCGQALREFEEKLPPCWSHANPVDIGGDASPERYVQAVRTALDDPNSHGVLIVLAPQETTDPTATAEGLCQSVNGNGKPVIASWMGGEWVAEGDAILNAANIPTFPYPDTAARVFSMMWQYSYNLRGLYETPALPPRLHDAASAGERVRGLIDGVRDTGRTLLTERESKQVLADYGIPVVETRVAASVDEAVAIAGDIGYPVVLKVFSHTITHKTDVGGVRLNLCDETAVRHAYAAIESAVGEQAGPEQFLGVTVQPMVTADGYELIVGAAIDPQFGPVLLFGSGGRMVEVYGDRSLALPPLNTTLARRMMEQTRIYRALNGACGRRPVDISALEQLLVRFSYLVAEQRWIKEIDINPLLASPEGFAALDARVVVHPKEMTAEQIPKLAIRPYPTQYVSGDELKDGTRVTIRPIRPEDEPAMVKFHEGLSERSVYFRYFHMLNLPQRVAHERLTRICFIDYDRELALVAEHHDPETGERRIIGVGRLTRAHATRDAEFAILVTDAFQGKGLGTRLLSRLIDVAKAEGVRRVVADMLSENLEIQRMCERFGFTLTYVDQTQMLHAELTI